MKKSYHLYAILSVIAFVSACSLSKKAQSESIRLEHTLSRNIVTDTFLLPEIPGTITDTEKRANFLVMHYWDRFDFNNEKLIARPEITEQAFVDYINILNYVPKDDAYKSLAHTLKKSETNTVMYMHFASLFEKYFYGVNSPFRNEEFYMKVIRELLKSSQLTNKKKSGYRFQREMMGKNRVGEKSLNFKYTRANGKTNDLYSIKSDYLILVFIHPGCSRCVSVAKQIDSSEAINEAKRRNTQNRTMMTMMTICPYNDVDEWTNHLHEFPPQWLHGYDKDTEIIKKRLYDIQAVPVIYLLDKNKTILLKNPSFETLEQFFSTKP